MLPNWVRHSLEDPQIVPNQCRLLTKPLTVVVVVAVVVGVFDLKFCSLHLNQSMAAVDRVKVQLAVAPDNHWPPRVVWVYRVLSNPLHSYHFDGSLRWVLVSAFPDMVLEDWVVAGDSKC